METTIQMIKDIQNGHTYEHSEVVDPFDNIIIKSKAYRTRGYFVIDTYEDNSMIEKQILPTKKEMLVAMRAVGREWE